MSDSELPLMGTETAYSTIKLLAYIFIYVPLMGTETFSFSNLEMGTSSFIYVPLMGTGALPNVECGMWNDVPKRTFKLAISN